MKWGNSQVKSEKFNSMKKTFMRERQLWLLCIPILIWVFIFAYIPMSGLVMAFFNYIPGQSLLASEFVGLQHFQDFIMNPSFLRVLRNTLAMSFLSLTVGFISPIILALCVNELHQKKFKKVVQTTSYLPHFISWVVAGSMVFMMLSNEGIVNEILVKLNFIDAPIPFLTEGKYYWVMYTLVNMWKGVGWSAIIYIAAISGVDPEMYEAGAVDGIGRFGIIRHIVIPTIMPTIILLWILGVGNILTAGFDQHLILGNASTQNYWDVIDTYAYRYGVKLGQYSIGTAVGLMKSIIGFSLVFITNKICKKHFDTAIF